MVRPDQDQLLRQAEIISALTQQRDLLLHQAEEQRLRWDSDKDGWARMAEALIAQQAKSRIRSENDEVGCRSVVRIYNPSHELFVLRSCLTNSYRTWIDFMPLKQTIKVFVNG